jgi:nuclease S1
MRAFKPWITAAAWAASVAAMTAWAAAAQAEPISPEDAAKHAGEDVTVCGIVAGAKYAAQVRGGLTFIDFGKPYPNASFTALIFAESRAKFGAPEKGLQGKQVCVSGKVQLFKGKAEMVLTDPKQLAVK